MSNKEDSFSGKVVLCRCKTSFFPKHRPVTTSIEEMELVSFYKNQGNSTVLLKNTREIIKSLEHKVSWSNEIAKCNSNKENTNL